ncbi:MAG: hypothetical protein ACOH2A_02685 [Sphingobacteriaceae bacterium]
MIRKTEIISVVVNAFFAAKKHINAQTGTPQFNIIFNVLMDINKIEIYAEHHRHINTAISIWMDDFKKSFANPEPFLRMWIVE